MKKFIAGAIIAAVSSFSFQGGAVASDLDAILKDRPAEEMARDKYRHPKETLEFFGISEGMTVVDALPGDWYGRILTKVIGKDGTYVGAAYSLDHYKKMWGERYEERKERLENAPANFVGDRGKYTDMPPMRKYFRINAAPAEMEGTVDAYLLFRATHHLNRFGPEPLNAAAKEAFKLVKSGGIVGVVQHRAPEDGDDEWAMGGNGYVKQSRVIEAFVEAGFVLEAASEINANPKDQPKTGDYVWRLPPANRESNQDIGESDRMTLKFRRP